MKKRDEMNNGQSTLNKAAPDEPLFILRPTDRNAPAMILHWIQLSAASGVPNEKLQSAFDQFKEISDWQKDHPELVKNPGV